MTIQQAYQQLLLRLYELYDNREAANIADWAIEHITGFKKIDRIINKSFPLNAEQQELFKKISFQLASNEPIQYVLGEAWFYGMKFFVNEYVLIPRPETEELVEWVIDELSQKQVSKPAILDIGTGSGCIPIAIKRQLPSAEVTAVDTSSAALDVAKRNATDLNTHIGFLELDFLNQQNWSVLPLFDVIVSNPPYVKRSEEATMRKNVLEYEPHLALFVPDDDPLVFYKKIAKFAQDHLQEKGMIFLEINEALGDDVLRLFESFNYTEIEIKKDLQGKDRMVRVVK